VFDADAARVKKPPRGVLVLHGFSGSPYEVRELGERLAGRGYHVVGPVLAGHERGSPEDLDRSTWRDWYRSAETAFDALRQRVEQVAVVGLSMGGLLALHLARERQGQVAAVAALATPIWLPRPVEAAIRAVNGGLRVGERSVLAPLVDRHLAIPKAGGLSDICDPAARAANPTMPATPVRVLPSLLELMRQVRGDLPGVRQPLFLAHARQDHTAPYACMAGIIERVGSTDIRALTLTRSYHVIPIDVDKDELARAVGDFLEERV
jgi:carboxylesterase